MITALVDDHRRAKLLIFRPAGDNTTLYTVVHTPYGLALGNKRLIERHKTNTPVAKDEMRLNIGLQAVSLSVRRDGTDGGVDTTLHRMNRGSRISQ